MRFTLALFIFLIFTSCKKVRLTGPKENDFLRGKFEWVFSYGDNNESESFETTTDRYAMRFKSSGTVLVYKNGVQIKKGYVSGVEGVYYNKRSISLVIDDNNSSVQYTDDTIEFNSWPIEDHMNIFQKQ
jgi:hypothetical protein